MLHVSLRQLEYVVAVGRAGSLSTAAAELRVSQPALSVAITQVEERVGEILFLRRKGVAITLTAFGRLFLEEAEALLARAVALEQPGRLSAKRQASVTIGILDELAPRWLARAGRGRSVGSSSSAGASRRLSHQNRSASARPPGRSSTSTAPC